MPTIAYQEVFFNPQLFLIPESVSAAGLTPDNVPSHHVQLCPGVDVQPDGDGGEKEDGARTETPLQTPPKCEILPTTAATPDGDPQPLLTTILPYTAAIRRTAILTSAKQFLPTIASTSPPATMMTANIFYKGVKFPSLPQPLLLGSRSCPHQGGRTLQVKHGGGREEGCQGGMRQRQVWWQFLEATTTRLLLRLLGTASSLILASGRVRLRAFRRPRSSVSSNLQTSFWMRPEQINSKIPRECI